MSEIQSVIFNKKDWTKKDSIKWLNKNKFKSVFNGKSPDRETKTSYRFRQHNPILYSRFITRSTSNKGVKMIIGFR